MLVRQVRSDASAHGPLDFNDWRAREVTGLYRDGAEAVACSNPCVRRDDLVLLLVFCLTVPRMLLARADEVIE